MNGLFGFTISKKLDEALDRTFKKFEEMSSQEIIELGRKHSGGDIATFLACAEGVETPRVQELTFVFNAPDHRLKNFVPSFEFRSILHSEAHEKPSARNTWRDIYDNCASLGAFSLSANGNLCQAA
jgi:hypothetical protein